MLSDVPTGNCRSVGLWIPRPHGDQADSSSWTPKMLLDAAEELRGEWGPDGWFSPWTEEKSAGRRALAGPRGGKSLTGSVSCLAWQRHGWEHREPCLRLDLVLERKTCSVAPA